MAGGFERKPGGGTLVGPSAGPANAGGTPGKRTLTDGLDHGPMRVTVNGLNVRSSPSKSGRDNVLGALHLHAQVEAEGSEGEWMKIGYRRRLAFVFGRYVEPIAPGPAASPAAHAPDKHADAGHAPDPEHVSPPPHAPDAGPASDASKHPAATGKPHEAEGPVADHVTPTPRPPAPAPVHDTPAPDAGAGHPPPPLDHMGKFVYQVSAGGATQQVLVYVAAGQLTLAPDVFVFFHGQWANYGIDPKQLADRKAAEQARIAREKADPSKDPKKIKGDETAAYVESGRDSSAEAMQHAQGKNVIAILPQGVMGGAGSTGGHMAVLTAKGGGLPVLIDSIMAALQKDLHGDRMKPGRISIAGHSAGGYMGVHEALASAGEDRDTITDVTLMDAEYHGAQFENASAWLLQGKGGKSFRIVASPGQLKTGLHLPYFGPDTLRKHAEAKGFSVVDKGGAGEPRGPKTTVVYHAQIMKGSELHADVLILTTQMGHHEIRDNAMDDAILNIGQGGQGGGDTFGTILHGDAHGAAAGGADKSPQTDAPVKPAERHPGAEPDHHEDAAMAPQHNPDPKAPETPAAPPDRVKVPSNTASRALYAAGGVLHVSHLTRGKGNTLDDQQFDFKQRVYLAATQARMQEVIYGGLADEDLAPISGFPVPETQRYRKIIMPALVGLLSAMDADGKAGKEVGGKSAKDYKGVGVASGYRGPKEEIGLWDRYFQKYLAKTVHQREETGDPYGDEAVKVMVRYIGRRKAAPGHSNHSNGTAVDVWALSKTHEISNQFDDQKAWYASWHYAWLQANASRFNFRNYPAEAWHWEYIT